MEKDKEVRLEKCESYLTSAANSDDAFDTEVKVFLDSLDPSSLEIVMLNDISAQVRHDNLPKAYRHLMSLLLTHGQKKEGLKSGGKYC